MAFETVFSTEEKLHFVKRAKSAGFLTRLFFICTDDPSINAQRVMKGGHDVPITKIINRYYRAIANCIQSLPWADRVYFYDNSVTNADPKLLFRVSDGKVAKIYTEISPWANGILDSIPRV